MSLRIEVLVCHNQPYGFYGVVHGKVQNKSSLVAKNHIRLPIDDSYQICGPVHGFVCLTNYTSGMKETVSTIYNLSTGQAIHLPNAKRRSNTVKSYLGFDPIHKQFKVLLITARLGVSDEHQVLTLGTSNPSWRNVKCCCFSYCYTLPCNAGICINGGLFYVAKVNMDPYLNAIVCFDVKSKKLRIVNKSVDMRLWSDTTLVNYKGKLGAFVLSSRSLYFVGVTGKDEIVLSKLYLSDPFYVYYYNIEGNTVTRVEIQGLSAFKYIRVHAL
ncbi:hypothetical protein Bca101_056377 [Brassica carinata]